MKKELLLSGYYKLAQNAYQLIGNNERYKALKEAQDEAEVKGAGIWKDAVKKSGQAGAQVTHNNKVFDAVLVEVHSGDSVTVFTGKKEAKRLFLASVRAP